MGSKRILFIISSLNAGGAQRLLSDIVCNLPEEKYDIDILLNDRGNVVFPYRGNLIDLSVKDPKNQNRNSMPYQLRVFIKRCRILKKLKKTRQYTACVSFMESANIVNVLTGRRHCKTIVTVNNCYRRADMILLRLIDKIRKFYYKRADRVVAVSKGLECHLVSASSVGGASGGGSVGGGGFRSKGRGLSDSLITTVRNGININEIRAKADEVQVGGRNNSNPSGGQADEGQENKPFTFITVGSLCYQKAQWHLIRAFAAFLERHKERQSDCRLLVLGEGPYVDYLQKLIDAYGLRDKVILKGFVENPFAELASADVFVLPYLYEGLSIAMLEAMICGLPVIASDFRCGAREVLAPDTDIGFEQISEIELVEYGIIIPVCSGKKRFFKEQLEPQELLLLEAMELMYTDKALRQNYCEASKKRASDFPIEKCVNKWRELL